MIPFLCASTGSFSVVSTLCTSLRPYPVPLLLPRPCSHGLAVTFLGEGLTKLLMLADGHPA